MKLCEDLDIDPQAVRFPSRLSRAFVDVRLRRISSCSVSRRISDRRVWANGRGMNGSRDGKRSVQSQFPMQLSIFQLVDGSLRVDSIAGMKAQLPALRKKLVQDPEYFKKVYMHTFSLSLLQAGARSLELDTGELLAALRADPC